jgi:membrane-associated protease RseP (regulator of RpoE activity)
VFAVVLLCLVGYERSAVIHYITPDTASALTAMGGGEVQSGSMIKKVRAAEGIDADKTTDPEHPVYKYRAKASQWTAGDSIELTLIEPNGSELIIIYPTDAADSTAAQAIYHSIIGIYEDESKDNENSVLNKSKFEISKINGKKMNFLPTTGADTILKGFRTGDTITLSLTDGGEIVIANASTEQKDIIKGSGGYIPSNDKVYHNFGGALAKSVPVAFEMAWLILKLLWQLVSGQLGMEGVGGTVATVAIMGESLGAAASVGFVQILSQMLFLVTLISINLAVFNWLPIPSLDGSRMVFTAIEWIRGKPINRDLEAKIHFIGIMCLFAFVIFADIYWSISRLAVFQLFP